MTLQDRLNEIEKEYERNWDMPTEIGLNLVRALRVAVARIHKNDDLDTLTEIERILNNETKET